LGSVSDEQKRRGLQLRTVYLIAYVAIIILAGVILLPDYWYLFLLIAAIALVRIAFYYVPPKRYHCSNCGNEFTQGKGASLRPSPDQVYHDNAKIKCPKCGSTNVARVKGK